MGIPHVVGTDGAFIFDEIETLVLGQRSWIAAGRGFRHRKGRRNAHSA